MEVVNLEGSKLKSIPKTILNNKSIKYFSCKAYLLTKEIKCWIQKEKLDKSGSSTFIKGFFFNYPIVG
ncbi:unnamed protein product [marine sediment metagenome]|uniref:Uncharacterized protein n=1 Tax=marine sediment metagenome TaxID=412755 RepID=X1K7S2_9ZZZZ